MTKLKPILELRNITKVFPGVKALDNVKLKLYPGKVTTLMGENGAGKSTIMKIIFGIHKKTSGQIFYKGKEVEFHSPKEALDNGIAMVHQELNQVLTANVMDNVWLGRFPKNGPFLVDKNLMYEKTKKIFDSLEIEVDPKMNISKLSVSERQMVEIGKAVSYNSKVLILDEPTSSLTEKEIAKLFEIINKLKKDNVAILFVSHKMDEIKIISDFVTIFRDGKFISVYPENKVSDKQIIKDMVGRTMDKMFPKKYKRNLKAETSLEIQNLSGHFIASMGEINFSLKKGHILGIAGLVGSKRSEIVELIFGLRRVTVKSKIKLYGKLIRNNSPTQSIRNKFALVTEERKKNGIFSMHDILFNTTITQVSSYTNPFKILQKNKMLQDTNHMIDVFQTKTPSTKTLIGSLSGGNQQKVVISKWLITQPEVLLLDEPTRGIDVGAKYQIYEWIQKLAESGKTIIVISSELPELFGVCHDILVMSNGKQAGILDVEKTNQEEVMKLASKYY